MGGREGGGGVRKNHVYIKNVNSPFKAFILNLKKIMAARSNYILSGAYLDEMPDGSRSTGRVFWNLLAVFGTPWRRFQFLASVFSPWAQRIGGFQRVPGTL